VATFDTAGHVHLCQMGHSMDCHVLETNSNRHGTLSCAC